MNLSEKPHIVPCREVQRPGRYRCMSKRTDGVIVDGCGYTPKEAYARWSRNYANPIHNIPRRKRNL